MNDNDQTTQISRETIARLKEEDPTKQTQPGELPGVSPPSIMGQGEKTIVTRLQPENNTLQSALELVRTNASLRESLALELLFALAQDSTLREIFMNELQGAQVTQDMIPQLGEQILSNEYLRNLFIQALTIDPQLGRKILSENRDLIQTLGIEALHQIAGEDAKLKHMIMHALPTEQQIQNRVHAALATQVGLEQTFLQILNSLEKQKSFWHQKWFASMISIAIFFALGISGLQFNILTNPLVIALSIGIIVFMQRTVTAPAIIPTDEKENFHLKNLFWALLSTLGFLVYFLFATMFGTS